MGQPVAVIEKSGSTPGIVRFELNRSLTGMGHERYASISQATGNTPGAVLARRLFETDHVDAVHVYANIVTVDVKKGFTSDGLIDIVRDLYVYYRPGVEPPSIESLMAAVEAPAETAAVPAASGDAASGIDPRVPPHLIERSRAARERWKAKSG